MLIKRGSRVFWILLCASLSILPIYAAEQRLRKLNRDSGSKAKLKKVFDNKLKRTRYFKDQVIIRFKKNTDQDLIQGYLQMKNLSVVAKLGKRSYVCKLNSNTDSDADIDLAERVINKAETTEVDAYSDIVEDSDIDEYVQIAIAAPAKNKTLLKKIKRSKANLEPQQWHLKNQGLNGSKPGADIDAEDAWLVSKGAGVKVAVIDTGCDVNHPDINFYSSGYDSVNQIDGAGAPVQSSENHCTAVSGIIAGKDDGLGIVGVAPDAQIIPIRLITDDGLVPKSRVVMAHQKAVELGAQIINNSWGTTDPALPSGQVLDISQLEKDLYKELYEEANGGKGVLIVFAAGNKGSSNFNGSPEARLNEVLTVGATDSTDKRASYSNYGNELDLVAPGGSVTLGIITTDRMDIVAKKNNKTKKYILGYAQGDTTSTFKGTSAAAPVVSGVAALVLAVNPNLSAKDLKDILMQSAEKLEGYSFDETGKNNELGYGRVNAKAAVDLAASY